MSPHRVFAAAEQGTAGQYNYDWFAINENGDAAFLASHRYDKAANGRLSRIGQI